MNTKLVRTRSFSTWLLLAVLLALPLFALSQAAQQNLTLIVNGRSGLATVVQISGRSYVEIETLARVANGSLNFKGNQIILTVPASIADTVPVPPSAIEPASRGFSREFWIRASRKWQPSGNSEACLRTLFCTGTRSRMTGCRAIACKLPRASHGHRWHCQRILIGMLKDCLPTSSTTCRR